METPTKPRLWGIWAIWAVLVVATLSAWGDVRGDVTVGVLLTVIALAMVKVALVMGAYMEVAHAPTWLRVACCSWGISVFGALAFILILG